MRNCQAIRACLLALCIGAAAVAQTSGGLVGTWQGKLPAGAGLRLVFQIVAGADGVLQGTMYSVDQQSPAIPLSGVQAKGAEVSFGVPSASLAYQGRISAGGDAIQGTFTQGGQSFPLNLARATPATAWAVPSAPAPLKPMPPEAKPNFEVADIRPSDPTQPATYITVRGSGRDFAAANQSLASLIAFAYGVQQKQIVGAAPWVADLKWDIAGKPDLDGAPRLEQWKAMLQRLLAQRFQLAFHHEQRELSVYTLVVGKTGSKMSPDTTAGNDIPALGFARLGTLQVHNATMADFCSTMQSYVLDRPVLDRTGLTGRFDFTLKWTPDETQFAALGSGAPPAQDAAQNAVGAPPDLFAALPDQLGLRLEATKAMTDVLVIDKASQPAN